MTGTIPQTMVAIGFDAPGGPDVLRAEQTPVPAPGAGEVLIKVAFAGVNRPDVAQRQGYYPPPPGASPIPGLELAGTVVAVGAGVEPEMLNQEVCALVTGGAYAEYCLAKAAHCLHVPEGLPLDQAAALPETLFTVWHNLFQRAYARDGETVLIHGGTSGIGTMAIQLARAVGARVAVTAGTADKLEVCRALGAEILVNYREQDFVEVLREQTDGHGADVILDNMGAKYLARNVTALADYGRLVVIGLQGGVKGELDLGLLLRKKAAVIATSLRSRPDAEKAAIVAAVREHVWPLVEAGTVRPIVHGRWPLEDAAEAHRVLEASTHVGKLLLTL